MKITNDKYAIKPNKSAEKKAGSYLNTISNQRPNYPFVDLIRFLSMIGIVWAHIDVSGPVEGYMNFINHLEHVNFYIAFMQIFKFSVICFFMISGFLAADRLTTSDPVQYYLRRLNTTLKPYIIAFLIYFLLLVFKTFVLKHQEITISFVWGSIYNVLFFSPLWYLPNSLISLLVIVLFARKWRSPVFGLCLLAITLVYSVLGVYKLNLISGHSTAIFAFTFYLWLGAYIKNQNLIEKIMHISIPLISMIVILLYLLSCVEAFYLHRIYTDNLNFFNVLRIFNQLYSVSVFALLCRLTTSKPNFGILNPRKETYGIYLYHGLFNSFLIPRIKIFADKFLGIHLYSHHIGVAILCHLLFFSICYLSTILLVKIMLKYNWGYLNYSKQ